MSTSLWVVRGHLVYGLLLVISSKPSCIDRIAFVALSYAGARLSRGRRVRPSVSVRHTLVTRQN